jgi:hypothetical protein
MKKKPRQKKRKAMQKSSIIVAEENQAAYVPPQPEALIQLAIERNVPVETMERLLAMQEKIQAKRAKEAFDKAMADFQRDCPTIEKTKQGYNYKYADLTKIVEQVKSLLADNGFSYTFDTDEADNAVIIYCKVKHTGGHMEISKARIDKETTSKMNASQQSGSAMTYGKRYALVNAFGILTGDEDTDGVVTGKREEKAVLPVRQNEPVRQVAGNGNGNGYKITQKQIAFIHSLFKQKDTRGKESGKLYTVDDLKEQYEITSLTQLTGEQASSIIERLMKLPDQAASQRQEDIIDNDEIAQGIDEMNKEKNE